MDNFRELLESDHVTVFDGAMGTMLYAKGVYINRSYDELNLTQPDLVREIHEEYVRAGAEVIETNTYGASAHEAPAVRTRRRACARSTSRRRGSRARPPPGGAYVAGAVGPLGLRIEPYGPTSFDEAKDLFKEQVAALLEGGVDLFLLETFSDISEMRQAIRAVRELCDLPVIAQMTIHDRRQHDLRHDARGLHRAARRVGRRRDRPQLRRRPGDSSCPPSRRCAPSPARKLSAQPNAGLPRDVQGRQFYMCSPEYMAKYAKRLIQAGVKFIGGCCGTTPAHIKLISDAVRAVSPRLHALRALVRRSSPRASSS